MILCTWAGSDATTVRTSRGAVVTTAAGYLDYDSTRPRRQPRGLAICDVKLRRYFRFRTTAGGQKGRAAHGDHRFVVYDYHPVLAARHATAAAATVAQKNNVHHTVTALYGSIGSN